MNAPVAAFLALGSNVGDRMGNLRQAIHLLKETPGVRVEAVAGVYETEPVGVTDQPWFLNTVAKVWTSLPPQQLLAAAKDVEASVGRTKTYRWGPREIDVDVLLYDEERVEEPNLVIPHPRMHERLFVLLPLREILPQWRDSAGRSIDDVIESLRGTAVVQPYPESP